ncbi:MAG: hypothetical protein M0R46_17810 [Candidatus Muirbacterium halophilum]|nr:hypothetical protein [Candidatus Muirbacterium halophilum]
MINEGKGISDVIKEDVDKIYQLFLDNSFSTHTYKFGKEKLGFRNLTIKFNHLNNYYSNIQIDKLNNITVNIGIPTNGKEKRVKENISHELTHVMEILGIGTDKEYPKYNKIKLSLREFKDYPMSKAMEFLTDVFYKTLDNEVNANVAQTYIYIKSDGRCSKEHALIRLKEWETYKLYDSIKNIKLDILKNKLTKEEVDQFNSLLIKNDIKTISSDNIMIWLNYWFKIFKRKADIFLKNSERILEEIEEDWKTYENYTTSIPGYPKVILIWIK